jgi:hypothetical protein
MKFLIDPLVQGCSRVIIQSKLPPYPISFVDSLYPVFVARIVLNIRQAANKGLLTELHTGYQASVISFAVPLQVVTSVSDDEHTE